MMKKIIAARISPARIFWRVDETPAINPGNNRAWMNCAMSFRRTRIDHQKKTSNAGTTNNSQNIWGAAIFIKIADRRLAIVNSALNPSASLALESSNSRETITKNKGTMIRSRSKLSQTNHRSGTSVSSEKILKPRHLSRSQ